MKIMIVAALTLLVVLLIGIGPLITIWSINSLFFTQITYSFTNWLAMVWIQAVTFGGVIGAIRSLRNSN